MDSQSIIKFEEICRLCVRGSDELFPILESISAVKIMDCVSLEVSAGDGKPQMICNHCRNQITSWYSFKLMCQKSDEMLQKCINANQTHVPEAIIEFIVKPEENLTWEDASENDNDDSFPDSFEDKPNSDDKYFDINTPQAVPSNEVNPSTSSSSQLPFHCKACNASFEDDSMFSNHNRIVHPTNNNFTCYFCGEISSTSIALIHHERTHQVKVKRKVITKKKLRGRRIKQKKKRSKARKDTSSESESEMSGSEAEDTTVAVKTQERAPGAPLPSKKGKQVCLVCGKKFLCMAVLVTHERRVHLGEPVFQCQECGKSYTTKRTLTTHMGSHLPEKLHPCDVCDKAFTHKTLMSQHKVLVHSSVRPFQCSLCPKSFIRRYMLKTHQVVHTKEKAFTCEHCRKDFSRRESLKVHLRCHSSEPVAKYVPPRRYMCTLCGKDYISPGELNRHELVTHRGERPFKCDLCDKAYASKFSLQVHKAIHQEERNHVCEMCGKRFNHSTRLSQHKSLVHHDGKPFKCFICDKSFLKPSLLKKHQVVHTGERCEKCHKCDKTFGTREGLKQHLKTHAEVKRFSCGMCGKRFAVNKSLKSHKCDGLPFVDKEKSIGCPTCGKKFISKKTLGRHMTLQRCDKTFGTPSLEDQKELMKSVDEVKRFACGICGKPFVANSSLKLHKCNGLPYVEKEKTVGCPVCGKMFVSQKGLERHTNLLGCV